MTAVSPSTRPDDPFAAVIGQQAAVTALRAALHADELAHAWLLVGPRGVGQAELAAALACAMNCPQPVAADNGCGTCDVCARIRRGVHPAITDLEPEGANHVVSAVREDWIPMASRTLSEGRRRVLRIVAADRMNEAAQNAFLKILEEPPPSVVWLLDVEEEGALLDTVVSRCRRLDLVPFGPEAMTRLADTTGIPAADRAALTRAAMGSPQRLHDLADPDIAAARERHLDVIDRLATGGPGVVVPLAKELASWAKGRSASVKERNSAELQELEAQFGVEGSRGWPPGVKTRIAKRHERLERSEQRRALGIVLDDIASYLRDLLAVHAGTGSEGLVNPDHEVALRRDVARLPAPEVVQALRAVATCRDALERNGAPELHLERLLMGTALSVYAAAAADRVATGRG
jgi:DNA polymerase III subunit delta'